MNRRLFPAPREPRRPDPSALPSGFGLDSLRETASIRSSLLRPPLSYPLTSMKKFFSSVPLFLFVFLFYNFIMAVAPDLVVPEVEDWRMTPAQKSPAAVVDPAPRDPSDPAAVVPADEAAAPAATEAKPRLQLHVNPLFRVPLISGAVWYPTLNDLIVLISVLVLYLEVFKATRTGVGSIIEHVFSLFVFLAFLIEFLVYKKAGTSTFLVVTLLSMIDVIGGFTITISTARRDVGFGAHNAQEE